MDLKKRVDCRVLRLRRLDSNSSSLARHEMLHYLSCDVFEGPFGYMTSPSTNLRRNVLEEPGDCSDVIAPFVFQIL